MDRDKKALVAIKNILTEEGWFTGCYPRNVKRSVVEIIIKIINDALPDKA